MCSLPITISSSGSPLSPAGSSDPDGHPSQLTRHWGKFDTGGDAKTASLTVGIYIYCMYIYIIFEACVAFESVLGVSKSHMVS